MFDTGKNITESSIDFDELARLYLSQHYKSSDSPEIFLVRFIRIREDMRKRFTKEPIKHETGMPIAAYSTQNH